MGTPELSLGGKVAIITGSSGGIGRTLALGFAEAGASVVLVARTAAELEAAADQIRAKGGKALAVPTDVTDGARVSEMVARAVKGFGRIDVLVNCAGGANYMPLLDMGQEVWGETLALNITGVYLCSRAAGRVMVEQKSGSIINFSSAVATAVVANMVHYSAAKAAVNQFTRVLAAEWGPYNIRVNAISPGLTDTSHTREVMGPDLFELYAKAVPLGRAGQPKDILGVAIFLASDVSSYISGAIIPVSGGPQ